MKTQHNDDLFIGNFFTKIIFDCITFGNYINDMLLSGTYAVMVPLNQFSAASISGGNIVLARWSVCQDVAIDLGTDWAVSHVCELCGADDYVATLAGLSIGTMAGFGGGKYDVDVPYPYIHGDNVSTNANWLNNYGYAGGILLHPH